MPPMHPREFADKHHHIPKFQLLEVFPTAPFLTGRTDMVTLDVGANMGLWSEAFLMAYGQMCARHMMFEPLSGNIAQLEERTKTTLSKLTPNPEVRPVAVGPTDGGTVELHFDHEHSTLASVPNSRAEIGAHRVGLKNTHLVPQISLDAELTRHGIETVDFLKIDVEGYEMQVLQGASEALAAGRIKVILFEFGAHHGAENETFKDFHDLLSGAGYDVYKAMRGRNFFGYGKVPVYREKHEPKEKYVEMVMASLLPPSPAYHGPPVISRSWAADPDKKRPVKEALYKIKQRVLRR